MEARIAASRLERSEIIGRIVSSPKLFDHGSLTLRDRLEGDLLLARAEWMGSVSGTAGLLGALCRRRSRFDDVIPVPLKGVPFDGHLGEVRLRHLAPGFVRPVIENCLDGQVVAVVVWAISGTTGSKRSSGWVRQLRLMGLKCFCSIGFH